MITVAFFNNRRGVGQTSLVYHVAWALTELGRRVLVADLDPQAGLSARCLREERLEELWSAEGPRRQTVFGAVHDLGRTLGEPAPVPAESLSNRLGLLVGDLALSTFEATLSDAWQRRHDRSAPSHRLTGALDRAVRQAALDWGADVALIDLGPNLSAINRAAVVTAEWLVTPLNADLFSVQALRSLGPALKTWRSEWAARVDRGALSPGAESPSRAMTPAGYVIVRPSLHGNDLTQADHKWAASMIGEYASALDLRGQKPSTYSFGTIKPYRSLEAMAYEARKPVFHLTAADGALGSHATAAIEAGGQFRGLARRLGERVGLALPQPAAAQPSTG